MMWKGMERSHIRGRRKVDRGVRSARMSQWVLAQSERSQLQEKSRNLNWDVSAFFQEGSLPLAVTKC